MSKHLIELSSNRQGLTAPGIDGSERTISESLGYSLLLRDQVFCSRGKRKIRMRSKSNCE